MVRGTLSLLSPARLRRASLVSQGRQERRVVDAVGTSLLYLWALQPPRALLTFWSARAATTKSTEHGASNPARSPYPARLPHSHATLCGIRLVAIDTQGLHLQGPPRRTWHGSKRQLRSAFPSIWCSGSCPLVDHLKLDVRVEGEYSSCPLWIALSSRRTSAREEQSRRPASRLFPVHVQH